MTDVLTKGARVGERFVVDEVIGRGASGVVWRAVQEPLGRSVALKVIAPDAADPQADARLLREAQAIARVRHENVVAVIDFGKTDRGLYLAMELVAGRSLRAHLERAPLPWREAAGIATGIARALAAAHEVGVVHRDLKPDNVMLADGASDVARVRVLDFGLAKVQQPLLGQDAQLSSSAVLVGTPAYMSPEQIGGAPEPRTDVYALGVVLYEMLTGSNPFRAESQAKSLVRHVEGPVPPPPSTYAPQTPRALDALVVACLQKSASARPAAAEVAAQLAIIASPEPAAKVAEERHTSRVVTLVAGATLLAVIGVATFARAPVEQDAGARDGADAGGTIHASGAIHATDVRAEIDGGTALQTHPPVRDAGARILDAGTRTARIRAPDAGVLDPTRDAGPVGVGLPGKIETLRARCFDRVPCARDVVTRFDASVNDLAALKTLRAEADACLAACSAR